MGHADMKLTKYYQNGLQVPILSPAMCESSRVTYLYQLLVLSSFLVFLMLMVIK